MSPVETRSNVPFRTHVFVCIGPRCNANGEGKILRDLVREEIFKRGLETQVRDTACVCFSYCSHGPNVMVYPEGILYTKVQPQNITEIFQDHILNGRPVERLMYRTKP